MRKALAIVLILTVLVVGGIVAVATQSSPFLWSVRGLHQYGAGAELGVVGFPNLLHTCGGPDDQGI